MLTDEVWSKLKPIMLENGVYDKSKLRPTPKGFFIVSEQDVPGEIYLWLLETGTVFTSDLMNGH